MMFCLFGVCILYLIVLLFVFCFVVGCNSVVCVYNSGYRLFD